MDKINQVGKILRQSDKNVNFALARDLPITPVIDRTRDIFDSVYPFEMEFEVPETIFSVALLDLYFSRPPDLCCAGCYCSICEIYLSDDTWITAYPFEPTSIAAIQMTPFTAPYYGEENVISQYVEIVNATTIYSPIYGASSTFPIKLCYTYRIEGCVYE